MTRARLLALTLPLLIATACRTSSPLKTTTAVPMVEEMRALRERPEIAAALAAIDRDRDAILAEWRAVSEIPAPSGQEGKRADYFEAALRKYGLTNVHRDAVGNVMGTRAGTGGGKRVVLDAHMDTVFAMDTDVTTRVENGRVYGPGIGDDTRNAIALLAIIRAMNEAGIRTHGDLTFVFTVEEETSFRGANQFLADHRSEIDRYIALDGGFSGFTYGGTGIYWHRYHIIGPGGHTRSDNPPYSAALPLARAIQRIYAIPATDTSWLNIGMLGGADVFNAKAADAWMSVDLRSTVDSELHALDQKIQNIVTEEAAQAGMTMKRDEVSIEEVASLPGHRESEMVRITEGVYRAFGLEPSITNTASNHTSAALRAGIPAVGMGAGSCEGSHGLKENCEIASIYPGIQRTLVLAVALSE
jgi:tripeptide aminopeptidase